MSRTRLLTVLTALVCAASLVGCGSTSSRLSPPAGQPQPMWVDQRLQPADGMRTFVGVAIAENALDEAHARQAALENAAQRVAQSVTSKVRGEYRTQDMRSGAPHLPGGQTYYQSASLSKVTAKEVIHGLVARQFYKEEWEVKPGFWDTPIRRYKYYVLAELSESHYQRLLRKAEGKVSTAEE